MENTPKIDVEDTTEEKKVLPTFQTWSPRDSARVESPVKTPNKRNSLIIGQRVLPPSPQKPVELSEDVAQLQYNGPTSKRASKSMTSYDDAKQLAPSQSPQYDNSMPEMPTVVVNSPPSSTTPNEKAERRKSAIFTKENVDIDFRIQVSLYKLDSTSHKWISVDNGTSTVTIFHEKTLNPSRSDIDYRIIALTKTYQYILNSWLDNVTYQKISDDFYNLRVPSEKSYSDYGIQFATYNHAAAFFRCFDDFLQNSSNSLKPRSRSVNSDLTTSFGSLLAGTLPEVKQEKTSLFNSARVPKKEIKRGLSSTSVTPAQSLNTLKYISDMVDVFIFNFMTTAYEGLNRKEFQKVEQLSCKEIIEAITSTIEAVTVRESIVKMTSDIVAKSLQKLKSQLCDTNTTWKGNLDLTVIATAKAEQTSTVTVQYDLVTTISNLSSSISSLSIQLRCYLQYILHETIDLESSDSTDRKRKGSNTAEDMPISLNQLLMRFVTCASCLVKLLGELLNNIVTLSYLKQMEESAPKNTLKKIKPKLSSSRYNLEMEVDIWDLPPTAEEESKPMNAATLNHLICKLTSDNFYDSTYMGTFIMTYNSFCTPTILFEKLKERHNVPEYIGEKQAMAIRARVIIALKYWMETQSNDFDERLLLKIENFLENCEKNLAESLTKVLEKTKIRLNLTVPERVRVLDYQIALVDQLPPREIAEYLTTKDFCLYTKINPTELLNQSWNTPKLKHKSPNVISLINRSTNVSFWAASMILFFDNIKQRVKMYEVMIDVCEKLFEMNNFNTLFAIVAGMSMSSITRLKKTYEKVSSDRKKMFTKLLDLISTDSSYKNYRNALKSCSPPMLPWIGVALSDLTFIETGNPDNIDTKINFSKREMIFSSIREMLQHQNNPFKFEVKEPFSTLFQEFPCTTDDQLYKMSLILEPRQAAEEKEIGTLKKLKNTLLRNSMTPN